MLADGLFRAALLGQLLRTFLFLPEALLLGQLLRAFLLGQLNALLFRQLLRTFLFGLPNTSLVRQLLRALLLDQLNALLFRQLLRTFLFGLPSMSLLGQLLRTLLFGLPDALLFRQLLRTFLFDLPNTSLLGQLLHAFPLGLLATPLFGQLRRTLPFRQSLCLFLPCARLRLVSQCRLVLGGLIGKPLALPRDLGAQLVLGVEPQTGLVRLPPPLPFALAFIGQAGALGPCLSLGRGGVLDRFVVGLGRRLRTGQRVGRGIGLQRRQRHIERVVPVRFLCDHTRVQAIRQARRRCFAAAFGNPPRRGRGRGRRCRWRWRRRDRIDEFEALARRFR
ncbi:hypothetical protein [Massilia putida]|uniref:hypothetical protein n=1 Tax=Massilia putida TaxID=1141883 RepID=UPI0009535219|nr:hypothetical protein [Massilia putida]